MKRLAVLAIFLLSISANAKQSFSSKAAALFSRGQTPTPIQMNREWTCFYEAEGVLRIGSSYGIVVKGDSIIATGFGTHGDVPLSVKKNSLTGTESSSDGNGFLSARIVQIGKHDSLALEESTDFPSWQKAGVKSEVTGHTPNLYLVCVEKNKLETFLFGN